MLKRDINNSVFIDDGRNHFLRIHFSNEFDRQNKMNEINKISVMMKIVASYI